MPRARKTDSRTAGLPPGTLVHLGERRVDKAAISVIDYSEADLNEHSAQRPEDCVGFRDTSTVTWINVVGLHDTELLGGFGEVFKIHPLLVEDIVNTTQRPKLEDHGDYIFMVVKMLYRGPDDGDIVSEQVSIILGRGYVLSFQEIEGDVFGQIRDRIRTAKGRIRRMGCDYLAYTLLDAIVDNYFIVMEDVGERIEQLQDTVISHAAPKTLEIIQRLKREMVFMRKNLWPLRELVSSLEKSESELVSRALSPYLRDVYEHTIQVIDTVESLRDMVSGALDIYMTTVSNRMNEVMKVLTVIATIFIPLTFVAGIYGMNFEHMPELKWVFGYPVVCLVMLALGVGMAVYFKRNRWF